MADPKSFIRSAWGITFWTAISRVTGVLFQTTVARFLGASAWSDAFFQAYRIPNTFRAIVGEGGLPGALVPIAKRVERERPGQEGIYAGRVFTLLSLVLFVLVAAGIAFAPLLVRLFAPGFQQTPGKFELTVRLTRWMFPYILLVSGASLLESYLNAKGRFQLSAATPIALNLSIILAAYLLIPRGVFAPMAFAGGVLFGGFLQFAMQVPAVRRLGFRFGASPFGDPEVATTAARIAPRLYASGLGQLNFLISSRTLAALGDGFITYNFLAWRVADLVLGGFVMSVTRAMLPSLSEQGFENDRTEYKKTVRFGLRISAFVTLPSMVGLALVAEPIIDILFRKNRFGTQDVHQTALSLIFFAPGIFAAAGVKILTQAFYALHDTKTPVLVATFDLIAFWILCVTLAGPFGHPGVAMATSGGFWINFILLFVLLHRRLAGIGGGELLASFGRLLAASAAMGTAVYLVSARLLPYRFAWGFWLRAGWLLGIVILATGLFLAVARLMGAPEVGETLGIFRRRKR
ncbi:MAG: murein biosynthesis integral membrane protein MurJ [Thermoanaerobaculia bacterium]